MESNKKYTKSKKVNVYKSCNIDINTNSNSNTNSKSKFYKIGLKQLMKELEQLKLENIKLKEQNKLLIKNNNELNLKIKQLEKENHIYKQKENHMPNNKFRIQFVDDFKIINEKYNQKNFLSNEIIKKNNENLLIQIMKLIEINQEQKRKIQKYKPFFEYAARNAIISNFSLLKNGNKDKHLLLEKILLHNPNLKDNNNNKDSRDNEI